MKAARGRPARAAPLAVVDEADEAPDGVPLLSAGAWAPLTLDDAGIDAATLHRAMVSGTPHVRLFAVFVARAAQVGPAQALEELR